MIVLYASRQHGRIILSIQECDNELFIFFAQNLWANRTYSSTPLLGVPEVQWGVTAPFDTMQDIGQRPCEQYSQDYDCTLICCGCLDLTSTDGICFVMLCLCRVRLCGHLDRDDLWLTPPWYDLADVKPSPVGCPTGLQFVEGASKGSRGRCARPRARGQLSLPHQYYRNIYGCASIIVDHTRLFSESRVESVENSYKDDIRRRIF